MAHHTFTNLLIHACWATQHHQTKIPDAVKSELNRYITGITKSYKGLLLSIHSSDDHVHTLLKIPSTISVADFMRIIKSNSSKWLRQNNKVINNFRWQSGYCAFSIHPERVSNVVAYIKSDARRHLNLSYEDEISKMLDTQKIPYQPEYLRTNTFTKLLMHMVWSTKNREKLLIKPVRDQLYTRIPDWTSEFRSELIQIGGVEDHVHLLVNMSKRYSASEFVKHVKSQVHTWLQSNFHQQFKTFQWQTGYGGYSLGLSIENQVKNYIANQEEHHKKISPKEEWEQFLNLVGSSNTLSKE